MGRKNYPHTPIKTPLTERNIVIQKCVFCGLEPATTTTMDGETLRDVPICEDCDKLRLWYIKEYEGI
jgi:hypothetical protein